MTKTALVGINIKALCDFAKNHTLLVSDTLLYECATTRKGHSPRKLLSRCQALIKEGAYFCQCSVVYVEYEGRYSCPYPWFLPDLEATKKIRTGRARLENTLNSPKTEEIFQTRCKVAKEVFLKKSAELKNRIDLERPDVGEGTSFEEVCWIAKDF